MHCQKDTVKAIVSGGGDYVIGLKGNQKLLYDDVALYMDDCIKDKSIEVETASTSEKSRNRFIVTILEISVKNEVSSVDRNELERL
jgi:predicted transposase YbfD/YdcC